MFPRCRSTIVLSGVDLDEDKYFLDDSAFADAFREEAVSQNYRCRYGVTASLRPRYRTLRIFGTWKVYNSAR